MKKFKKRDFIELFLVIIIPLIFYFFNPYKINLITGNSMYPTLIDKTFFVTKKDKTFKVGDIVTVKNPWDEKENKNVIKRIIAKEGDTVKIYNNTLFVNEKKVVKMPIKFSKNDTVSFKIDKDFFFIMGDNFINSNDSLSRLLNPKKNKEFLIHKDKITTKKEQESKVKEIQDFVISYYK